MKIKSKLTFIIPILTLFLFIFSYFNFNNGYHFNNQVIKAYSKNKLIMQEVSSIGQEYKLKTIEENIKNFMILVKNTFTDIEINNLKNKTLRAGVDRVGEFRDFVINAKGDYLSQVYLLEQVNNFMRYFVVINSLTANNKSILLKVRIYGRTGIRKN